MTLGEATRRRLLVVAVLAALWILGASLVVALAPHAADHLDRWFGQGIAAFADRHPRVESVAEGLAAAFRFLPVLAYTVLAAAVLVWRAHRRRKRPATAIGESR
jgi:hypothetical protein